MGITRNRMSNMLIEVIDDRGYPLPYGNLPECYKDISIRIDSARKAGCSWIVNGEKCKKPCVSFILYCEEHKDISDIKRPPIHEPLTKCRKRKPFIQYVNA